MSDQSDEATQVSNIQQSMVMLWSEGCVVWGRGERVDVTRSAVVATKPASPGAILESEDAESTYRVVATGRSQMKVNAPVALVSMVYAQGVVGVQGATMRSKVRWKK
jgi:GH24 family phage-related lysozyme (muramidase)